MATSKISIGNKYDYYYDTATNIAFLKTNGVVTLNLERSTIYGTTYAAGTKIVDIPEAFLPMGNGISFRETLRNTRLQVSNTTDRKGLYAEESTEGYNIRGGITYVAKQPHAENYMATSRLKNNSIVTNGYLENGTDLDNVLSNSVYSLAGSSTYPNMPSEISYGVLETIFHPDGFGIQQIFHATNIYFRFYDGSSWKGWRKVTNTPV